MAVGSWPRGIAQGVLAQGRPFPTASLWGNVEVPGTGHPCASVSRVPPLWSPGCVHTLAGETLLWKRGPAFCSRAASWELVWVDLEGPG